MGDVVNLNKFRKRRQREDAADAAAENRRKFGRTRAERSADRKETETRDKTLDGKKIDDE
tara:strand:+ start:27 stop:206 length:180 start_codon:yes stop_codon:yes gene_type:complete